MIRLILEIARRLTNERIAWRGVVHNTAKSQNKKSLRRVLTIFLLTGKNKIQGYYGSEKVYNNTIIIDGKIMTSCICKIIEIAECNT